jgi:hypothetical protein
MRKAVQQEPGNWEYHRGLVIAESYAGIDPRARAGDGDGTRPEGYLGIAHGAGAANDRPGAVARDGPLRLREHVWQPALDPALTLDHGIRGGESVP